MLPMLHDQIAAALTDALRFAILGMSMRDDECGKEPQKRWRHSSLNGWTTRRRRSASISFDCPCDPRQSAGLPYSPFAWSRMHYDIVSMLHASSNPHGVCDWLSLTCLASLVTIRG
jgi:hypothetical protein